MTDYKMKGKLKGVEEDSLMGKVQIMLRFLTMTPESKKKSVRVKPMNGNKVWV